MTSEKKDITKPTIGDVIHANVKGGLGAIPVWGSLLSENFALLIVPPATKRRDEFLFSVEKDLRAIEMKIEGFNIEALSQNELFVTTLLQATQIAIRSHQQEKLEALRNAVINTALANEPKEDMQLMFLNWIDTMTPWHIKTLQALDKINEEELWEHLDKDKKDRFHPQSKDVILQKIYTQQYSYVKDNLLFFDQIFEDLKNKSLITINVTIPPTLSNIPFTISGSFSPDDIKDRIYFKPAIHPLGKTFLAFIESPLQNKE